jgi:hypothetical protein
MKRRQLLAALCAGVQTLGLDLHRTHAQPRFDPAAHEIREFRVGDINLSRGGAQREEAM